jgi:CMP-N-acetylneuraminic acid synthetase
MEKEKIVALIPVREGSQRVKEKNFREFANGHSLLEIKIEQAKEATCFDHIYISSDSDRAKNIALENGVEFLPRDSVMCNSETPWAEVVGHIMETIPGDPIVTWGLTTSPTFKNFKGAVTAFKDNIRKHDSLVAVLPKKTFFLNKYGKGINYNPGLWHPYSQELETYFEVTGACYIGRKSDMVRWHYWFGVCPYLFEVSNLESIDVDTPDDFHTAQQIFKSV